MNTVSALYIILFIIAGIVLLLSIPVGINLVLEDELRVYLRVLFLKIKLYPSKKKKFNQRKHEKKKKKKESAKSSVLKERDEIKSKPTLLENISTITEIVRTFFKHFSKHLHVKLTKIHIKVATPDAAETAILYGAVSGAVACLVELIDSITNLGRIKQSSIAVEPDFLSEKSIARLNISLYINSFGAIIVILRTLIKYFILKNKNSNNK